MTPHQTAIIDMGSNSIRLVIYQINTAGIPREIQNLKVTARLSSYIATDGNMTATGIAVILDTLHRFSGILKNYHLEKIRCVATAAIRNATNLKEILGTIESNSNIQVTVLSEKEEAYYGYLAIIKSTNLDSGITIDIGGGSTEITYFENKVFHHYHSFPFGAITLKQRFFNSIDPSKAEINELKNYLYENYSKLPWIMKRVPIIGIGGSARNLALIHQHQIEYPMGGLHQYEMTLKNINDISIRLISSTNLSRQQIDGLSKERSDIIIPAIIAIQELLHVSNNDRFIVSSKGLRDGLFYEMHSQFNSPSSFPSVAEESLHRLNHTFVENSKRRKHAALLSSYLVKNLNHLLGEVLDTNEKNLLKLGTELFNIGATIQSESKNQHTFYLLTNTSIEGLNHYERLAIASIASFKSRSQLHSYLEPFQGLVSKGNIKKLELMGSISKLCYVLDTSNLQLVHSLKVTVDNAHLVIHVYYRGDTYFEQMEAEKHKKHLEKALNKEVRFLFHEVL